MAAGDWKWFAQGLHDIGNKLIDLDTDVLKFGLVTAVLTPTVTLAAPCWGAGGTNNMSTNQIATATSYTGPVTLASVTWTKDATGAVLDFADPSVIAQDAGGATNIAWLILYSDTAANKNCIGYQELSAAGTISLVAGSLTLTESASGVLRMTQS
jgi:hypothetical protein